MINPSFYSDFYFLDLNAKHLSTIQLPMKTRPKCRIEWGWGGIKQSNQAQKVSEQFE
jgi:hypothetical protein